VRRSADARPGSGRDHPLVALRVSRQCPSPWTPGQREILPGPTRVCGTGMQIADWGCARSCRPSFRRQDPDTRYIEEAAIPSGSRHVGKDCEAVSNWHVHVRRLSAGRPLWRWDSEDDAGRGNTAAPDWLRRTRTHDVKMAYSAIGSGRGPDPSGA
jgi:hypothetical protein